MLGLNKDLGRASSITTRTFLKGPLLTTHKVTGEQLAAVPLLTAGDGDRVGKRVKGTSVQGSDLWPFKVFNQFTSTWESTFTHNIYSSNPNCVKVNES